MVNDPKVLLELLDLDQHMLFLTGKNRLVMEKF